ncbi:hypothetical protein BH24BAC1_BH24BAC1_03970 [soil metagenome]
MICFFYPSGSFSHRVRDGVCLTRIYKYKAMKSKTLKKTILLLAIFWSPYSYPYLAFSQSTVVEKTLPLGQNQPVELQLKFGNHIRITGWDRNEVQVKVTYEVNQGRLNDALLLDFASGAQGVKVTVEFDQEKMKQGRAEDCPDNAGYTTYNRNNGQNTVICSQIDYEIFVPRQAQLQVNTINGNIELVDYRGPVEAKSISGFVDMNWANDRGATVALKTITGEV